ncbi:rRNA maturation RNase YbeY [Desulfovibrio litoralis]|uniref:Endoribonuclease YbeY n=1 Tax=Desulfovibrio litoralis DSM 11393 TaxID=1121455 RepID=A0A1M7SWK5_9BACT|nr:rRNA maturation RNase YbeY [Desulfovibrio litoralis]SHN62786.1 probable rRNA maturation factor [Desulfovibrio litoralis DSM 11393]
MKININAQRAVLLLTPLDLSELKQILSVMLNALGYKDAHGWVLNVCLVDDNTIEEYNNSLFALSGPTNVLSFPAGEQDSLEKLQYVKLIGELVLSVDTVKRESFLYGQDEREHFLWLLAHGLAHLGSPEQLKAGGLDHGEIHDNLSQKAFESVTLFI